MEDRSVVIAGGAGGLGRATARLMLERGARVALIDVSAEALEDCRRELAALGHQVELLAGGITKKAEAGALFSAAAEQLGPVRALVNCVGIYPRVPILEITDEEWRESLSVNVVGTYNLMAAAAAHMRALEPEDGLRGRIVNISSIDAFKAHPNNAHYAAGKAAVVSLTRSFALEFGPDQVLVNSVAPGAIATEQAKKGGWLAAHDAATPLGRSAEPRDIAEMIAFLAGSANRYTTGENVIVSGGHLIA